MEFLVGELAELREMLVGMKRTVTGHGLEEKGGETGDREVGLEEQDKEIRPGTQMLATLSYRKNLDGPVGNELDLNEGETLVYLMKHDDNEPWWLAEDRKGQVEYVPSAYVMIIIDETLQEEDSDTTMKEGQGKRTDGTKSRGEKGQDGERRRKTYSATVIDGFKRNSTIYVGDSIVRKTDTRLSEGKDVVVCLPGARIEHVTERVEQIMGRGNDTHRDEQRRQGRDNSDSGEVEEPTEEDEASKGWTYHLILPVLGNRIRGYRNSKRMAVNGMVRQLCKEDEVGYVDLWDSFVGKEEIYARDDLHLSGRGGGLPFCRGTARGGYQWLW